MHSIEKLMLMAREIGMTYAKNMYKDFTEHPEYKGAGFTWKNFPYIVSSRCEVDLFMYIPEWQKLREGNQLLLKATASLSAFQAAYCLVQSDLGGLQ